MTQLIEVAAVRLSIRDPLCSEAAHSIVLLSLEVTM
jgi:hypothetical protein